MNLFTRRFVVLAGAALGTTGILLAAWKPELYSVNLVALAAIALLGWCGTDLSGLLAAYLVSSCLIHLLKRVIFLFGPQTQEVYIALQLGPGLLLIAVVLAALPRLRRRKPSPSSVWMAAFLAVALLSTGLSLRRTEALYVGTAVYQQLLPFALYWVGQVLTQAETIRALKTTVLLAGASALYGMVQFISGPTFVDRAWAAGTYQYSIHGGKVLDYIEGRNPEFRAFSFYADPLTWGLFLLAGMAAAAVARDLGVISRAAWRTSLWLCLAGLFCAMTRTSWLGFAVMITAVLLMRFRSLRRPWLVFSLAVSLFGITVVGGSYLYREVFLARRLPVTDNPVAQRYLTVGTIEARMSAWEELQAALREGSVIGSGNAALVEAMSARGSAATGSKGLVHNVLVQITIQNGWLGALLFLGFVAQWLREAFRKLPRATSPTERRAIQWLIAFGVGSLATGYLNGGNFLTHLYFLLTALVAGGASWLPEWSRIRADKGHWVWGQRLNWPPPLQGWPNAGFPRQA
ncbi:MAG: O-antigen ligase family protein [Bryobacteraceae bacterium]|nr:O-antigen ligase family protein [Bryobacteraceae bacterium]